MTEEEARGKMCPMGGYRLRCAASDCMMWRWHTATRHDGSKFDTYINVPTKSGYCGLAGRPDYD